jgi:hypothetical protein
MTTQIIPINLLDTKDYGDKIIPEWYIVCAQAAAMCLEVNRFNGNALLIVEGAHEAQFALSWTPLSDEIKDMNDDLIYAIERGAYCIAFLTVHQLSPFKILKQARRGTGFDYWLTDKDATFPFQQTGRLEVSGILEGGKGQINARIKLKEEQITQSSVLGLPAYIVVTEFSHPISKMILKP